MESLPSGSPRLAGGRFVVVGKLRRGTITTSWRVHDNEVGDWRTLRLVDANIATREDAQRFASIGRELIELDHPNVVRMMEVGTLKGGVPFILTEYVPGGTLARGLARSGALTPRAAGLLLIEIVDALISLHQLGIVHREIAAEHVLVAPNGATRLTDFDLALHEGRISRRVAGVAAYRSPEQVAAETDPSRGPASDRRTDVFAVGVLLWTLLHGEVPRAITRLHSDPNVLEVDPVLAPVIAQCLGHDTADRYASMESLAEELLQAIGELPEEGDPPNLVLPPEEQAVTGAVPDLGRVTDTSTDATPAWLEERPHGAEPLTHHTPATTTGGGKVFTPSAATGASPAKKWFDTPPSVPAGTPADTSARAAPPPAAPAKAPSPKPVERAPAPPPIVQTIGAPTTPPPSADPDPSWLERSILPVVAAIGGLTIVAIAVATSLGIGMLDVEQAHAEAERAELRLLDLMDQQRRAVEHGLNAGMPPQIEQGYLKYTQSRSESDRLSAATAFVHTIEELGYTGPPSGEAGGGPVLASRQLLAARDKFTETQAAWKVESEKTLGWMATRVGLAEGYQE